VGVDLAAVLRDDLRGERVRLLASLINARGLRVLDAGEVGVRGAAAGSDGAVRGGRVAGDRAVRGGDMAVERGGRRGVRGMQARDLGSDAGADRRRGHPARAAELGGVLLDLGEQGMCGGGAGCGRTDRGGAAVGGGRRGGGSEGPRLRERGARLADRGLRAAHGRRATRGRRAAGMRAGVGCGCGCARAERSGRVRRLDRLRRGRAGAARGRRGRGRAARMAWRGARGYLRAGCGDERISLRRVRRRVVAGRGLALLRHLLGSKIRISFDRL
jgi:hypothetical protein